VRKFEFTPVDLNVVFTKAVQDLEIAITENNATITAAPLPTVDGDETQLVQLFENLVSNSLKFAKPHVPPVITLSAETVGDHAVLTIADNGIGFGEQYTTKMFDLFQKLHTRDKYAGTGIGLSICKKIVDTHKGAISANSNLGDGATFIIKLPLKQHKD
jgi:light-regulated signal transduction histidine kinase (bacteriophytochrome)